MPKYPQIEPEQKEYIEITFRDISLFFKQNYKYLILTAFISGCLGYAISFLSPKMYKSQTTLLPEQSPTTGGLFASLAGLGGLSALEKIGAVKTDLYPNVMESLPFALFLLKQPIINSENKKFSTLEEYILSEKKESYFSLLPIAKKSKKQLPKLENKNILNLTEVQEQSAKGILSMLSTNINSKTGIITIEAEAKDPFVAAILVDQASNYLLNYVEEYRTGKTAREVIFLEKRMAEAKRREQKSEYALQNYRDRNRNAYLNVARIEEQRLQADFTLAQSLYSDLARKYEQAKIKVKEEQPIFKILEPAKVPLNTSKPRRLIIAISFSLLGILLNFIYLVSRNTRQEL